MSAPPALTRLNAAIARAGGALATLFLAIMVVVILLQVVFRYVLNDSLAWTEELSKLMMVWVAFLVAPHGYRTGAHISIELFRDALPARLVQVLNLGVHALILWIAGVFFLESLSFWQRGLAVQAASLPIPLALAYSVLPVSLFALGLVALERLLEQLGQLARPLAAAVPEPRDIARIPE